MTLYEYEGKKLLEGAGISVSKSQLLDSSDFALKMTGKVVLKAQVLSGKRAESGGIVMINDPLTLDSELLTLFQKTINGERVKKVLVEEKVEFGDEYYVSVSYDTDTRSPVLTVSKQGGTGVEERETYTFPIDPIKQIVIPVRLAGEEFLTNISNVADIVNRLIKLFFDQDCLLVEINPLVRTKNGWVALDAKIKLDDDAKKRHEGWDYPPRLVPGHTPTKREIEAKKIDETDYRGTAGSTYFDLDGDIAVLSSGGGVSLTAMDAVISFGGKPANFTEYSGNPPREKVNKLTKIVLSKPNIHGLWVIGTVAANFTDIYETLSGFIEGLREAEKELKTHFNFPIVIRRGGPNESQAFEMLRSVKDFDLHLQGEETSIAESAKIMAKLASKYKESSR